MYGCFTQIVDAFIICISSVDENTHMTTKKYINIFGLILGLGKISSLFLSQKAQVSSQRCQSRVQLIMQSRASSQQI